MDYSNLRLFNHDGFAKNIHLILRQFAYEMYLVRTDQNMTCTCVDPVSKAPDLMCEKCLGTGFRIRIQKVKGANRENKVMFRTYGTSENGTTNIFYFEDNYPIKEKDLIYDSSGLYIVQRYQPETGANNKVIYYRAEANPEKQFEQERIKNLEKIISGG